MAKGPGTKVWIQPLTSLSTTDQDEVGSIRFEAGKVYKYVKFDWGTSTVDVTAGDIVLYVGSNGYTNSLVTADYSDASLSTSRMGAGSIQAAATTTNQFMWIQVNGVETLKVTLGGTATDGSPLTLDGAADKAMDLIATLEPRYAIAEDASAQIVILDFPW